MAELSSIFNEKASNKLRNPDDLDRYVRVNKPSGWVVFAACAALVAGLLSWGAFGTVSTNVGTTGAVVDGTAMCFLSTEAQNSVVVGDVATFGGEPMKVSSIAAVPMSKKEVDWASTLVKEDWAYQVLFEGDVSDLAKDVPLAVNISTERVAPLELLVKSR